MRKGKLSSNCSGTFLLHYAKSASTHLCGEPVERVHRGPVLVSNGNCTKVLLDHDDSEVLVKGDAYLIFWMSVSAVLLVILVPVGVLLCFLARTGTRGGREFLISKAGIKLNSPISDHTFTWKKVILIGLCFIKPTYESCVSPTHQFAIGEHNQLEYTLLQHEEACLTTTRFINKGTRMRYAVAHLYETSDWHHTTWTAKKCGYGDCGSEEECAYWGDVGRMVTKEGTVYLKQCRPHGRPVIQCFYKWGCWLSTKEVHYSKAEKFQVYQIGKPVLTDQIVEEGKQVCSMSASTDAGLLGLEHLSLVHGKEDWLCSEWSPRGAPKAGLLGDIQYLSNTTPMFDFSAFSCDTSHSALSGNCEVLSTGVSRMRLNCLKLPAFTDVGLVSFSDGVLSGVAGSVTKVSLLCGKNVSVVHSIHDCFDKVVTMRGIREEGSLQVLVFRAKSLHWNSTWIVESSCFATQFEIPCDGEEHGHPIRHTDPEKCLYSGMRAKDDRKDEEGPRWAWDNTDHQSIITESHAISITTIILLVVVLCVLRLICH